MSEFDVRDGLKLCSRCRRRLPETEFGRNRATRSGLKYFCKKCVNDKHRKWAEMNPDKVRAAGERQKRRRKQAFDLLRAREKEKKR